MGQVGEFEREKLIIGIIYNDENIYREALELLVADFGPVEDESERFSFSKEYSNYYDRELGGEGQRVILSFKETVDPSRQAEIKLRTNDIEARFDRRINLDPGFMSHGRLLLATTKPTGFRIALSGGIYTELTLFYARGKWQKLPWTYRDYQSERVQKFLSLVRKKYLNERKKTK
ncbi:MAG: DUF4416 family protein [Clostridia bacterium]|nr:DUF4416 family protein [Clostridia bacterium]